jgi:hypothetical protein
MATLMDYGLAMKEWRRLLISLWNRDGWDLGTFLYSYFKLFKK